MTKRKEDENPLLNIFVNVLLPIVALSQLSKSGDKFWHTVFMGGNVNETSYPKLVELDKVFYNLKLFS